MVFAWRMYLSCDFPYLCIECGQNTKSCLFVSDNMSWGVLNSIIKFSVWHDFLLNLLPLVSITWSWICLIVLWGFHFLQDPFMFPFPFMIHFRYLLPFNIVLEAVSCTTQVDSVNIHYYSGSSELVCFHILCINTLANFWSKNSVIIFNYHT